MMTLGRHDDTPAADEGVRGPDVEPGQDPAEPRGDSSKVTLIQRLVYRFAEYMWGASGTNHCNTQATGCKCKSHQISQKKTFKGTF